MRRLVHCALLLAGAFALHGSPAAQVRPVYSLGAAGLTQVLERLQTTASVLHTAAHPDDEDTFFIARTARGDHARVAYLALNRGEGGQNIIGTELFEALGVIRTEELLQARRLDGGQQFFTRTYDYGFSKSLEEASAKWDEQAVLGDMVRVIRTFRPLVIYSRFGGTSADGHGHHQFAGYITPKAFRAAADPAAFPEQIAEGLRPWQARKLYRGQRFGAAADDPPSVTIQVGAFDPVIGRSYAEIAAEGRSQHKSQSMGSIEVRGPIETGLRLVESTMPLPDRELSVFDGIDTSITGIAGLSGLPPGTLQAELQQAAAAATRALDGYNALRPAGIIPDLAAGLRAVRAARVALAGVRADDGARAEAGFLLGLKEEEFSEALVRAAGIVIDPLADRETVLPGRTVGIDVRVFAPIDREPVVAAVTVRARDGWPVSDAQTPVQEDATNPFLRRERPAFAARFTSTVPADAPPTAPYFLERPRDGESYAWDHPARGLPFAPPLFDAQVTLVIGGERVTVSEAVEYRTADPVRGELRRPVAVTPAVTVSVDSKLLIVPLGTTPADQALVVQASSFSPDPVTGTMRLRLPSGWTSSPAEVPFTLGSGEQSSAAFTVRAPAGRRAGRNPIVAEAVVAGDTYSEDVQVVAYPHIQTHRLYSRAEATAQVLDLQVSQVRVGYIMGTGDEIPEALRRMGVHVTLLDAGTLATGDLSTFDTIVVGIRASQARPDFVANHGRLMQYLERGGTLIVQYQQQDYVSRKLTPFPAEMQSRVTDEQAPVEILEPSHPLFTFPNRITAADFDGWVQDRNLYAFRTFDGRYTPLLASADRGEAPQLGGQVYTEIGKGRYVYTAYAWFRQLPAGVPGAYRLFANLVSLSKAPR
ncbi:MAG: PIG-L family deacetylase [Acidimicrobiia bacterium]|nr:PIG-L family deacetylase [Acidimicrobiia bacterium]